MATLNRLVLLFMILEPEGVVKGEREVSYSHEDSGQAF